MAVTAEGRRGRPERHTGVAAIAAVELAVHGCEMAKFGRVLPQPCFIRAGALEQAIWRWERETQSKLCGWDETGVSVAKPLMRRTLIRMRLGRS